MRRAVAALMGCFPFDDRSRRALDETLHDWRHEEDQARGLWGRSRVSGAGLLGVARTVAGSIAREVAHLPFGWLLGRLALVAAVPSVVLALAGWGHVGPVRDVAWASRFELAALALPQAAVVALPAALFIIVAYSGRHGRITGVGLAAATLVGVLAIGGWVFPLMTTMAIGRTQWNAGLGWKPESIVVREDGR